MRLQKFMAHAGVASRRACEEIIRQGRVTVNGKPAAEPGVSVNPATDRIALDGKELSISTESRTFLIYKPRGYISSVSSAQGKSVLELIPPGAGRLYPVGRLDKDSEGLLLLTNDGELSNRLTHPRYNRHKTYEVTVEGEISPGVVAALNRPMEIDGYRIRPAKVTLQKSDPHTGRSRMRFVLHEGRNRQIRKMCEKVNLRVRRLVRTAIHDIKIDKMKPGEWRELSAAEIRRLMSSSAPS